MNQVPHTKRGFWELLVRSSMEGDRFSPRLATVFAFVLLTIYLEYQVVRCLFEQNRPTEGLLMVVVQIIVVNVGLIAALLGLGKFAQTVVERTKIQADAQVQQAQYTGQPAPGPATATTTTTTTLTPDMPI